MQLFKHGQVNKHRYKKESFFVMVRRTSEDMRMYQEESGKEQEARSG